MSNETLPDSIIVGYNLQSTGRIIYRNEFDCITLYGTVHNTTLIICAPAILRCNDTRTAANQMNLLNYLLSSFFFFIYVLKMYVKYPVFIFEYNARFNDMTMLCMRTG